MLNKLLLNRSQIKKYLVLTLIVLITIVGYKYLYKEHRIIENEIPRYSLTAQQIYSEFNNDFEISQNKYGDKIIEVSGLVSEINETDITIDNKVFCQFTKQIINREQMNNSRIIVKGRLIGYDDLLEQVKLDQCLIN
ncbi:OB-fold protein [Marixanthomonas spongiae]|uniref:tRNA_anti-like n=1 Tax=Marixanthomonas spongiae TaxID=2174845 RepID=A0A2U0HU54_9FLAO|nr:hypothetical protein [Marixanthomonas spongiae]PVW12402.1 hypothetical protein DDV96_14905 [Marixanthomonas spongiae]